jgi:glycerol-1-phosphate dehydrogenase [NAD(P)+]
MQVVYAVGGGLAADAGKYLAAQLDLPLTVLPTALSVDAFLTAASGVRRASLLPEMADDGTCRGISGRDTSGRDYSSDEIANGIGDHCVYYLETKTPDHLILDLEVIAAAPAAIRAAGITDVLSIATGCWDWQFAHAQGQNPDGMEFNPWVYTLAQDILAGALACAEAAGRGDPQGLKALYDCLALEVQLCNQVGHARPEEGSEHYFAYAVENFTGPGWPHGDLVGPGILLMASCQGQDTQRYAAALRACQVPHDRIPESIISQTLQILPAYCRRHGLAFGIAHTLHPG